MTRPQHAPVGPGPDCERCSFPIALHEDRNKFRESASRHAKKEKPKPTPTPFYKRTVFVAVDSESITVRVGKAKRHVLVYVSAVDEFGRKLGHLRNPSGLGTSEVLAWVTNLRHLSAVVLNEHGAFEGGRALTERERGVKASRVGHLVLFGGGYDWTKWLEDLPDEKIYLLVHPENRPAGKRGGHKPVGWSADGINYALNFFNNQLTVARHRPYAERQRVKKETGKYPPKLHSVQLTDIRRFFTKKFVDVLSDWAVGTDEERSVMAAMKDKRGAFRKLTGKIERYCDGENACCAKLARALVHAHEDAGIPLRHMYGAGSTSEALLSKLGVKDFMYTKTKKVERVGGVWFHGRRPELGLVEKGGARTLVGSQEKTITVIQRNPTEPPLLVQRQGFVGGRFELAQTGPVEGTVYNADICSAYPYHLTFLPCLVHGRWTRIRGSNLQPRIERARLALVHASVEPTGPAAQDCWGQRWAWGPFPFRHAGGEVVWPVTLPSKLGGGTWVWKDEFLAGQRHFAGVKAHEAFVYDTDCDCQPFAELPEYYRQRLQLGPGGKGEILKLGPNGVYGKCAQTVGSAPFHSWIYAGVITSNTRAQLLDVIGLVKDRWNVLMVATDGIWLREDIRSKLPLPRDTKTNCIFGPDGQQVNKPALGAWDWSTFKSGVMLVRPGIYFPLDASESKKAKEVRSRGVPRTALLKHQERIVAHWHRHQVCCLNGSPKANARLATAQKTGPEHRCYPTQIKHDAFIGMKAGVLRHDDGTCERVKNYGLFYPRETRISHHPLPKRELVGPGHRLKAWETSGESAGYDPSKRSPEARALKDFERMLFDQPDQESQDIEDPEYT